MKTIAILAVTAPGAAICYETIMQHAAKHYSDFDNPNIIMWQPSVVKLQQAWQVLNKKLMTALLLDAVRNLSKMDIDFIVIPSNTMHYVFKEVQSETSVPIVNMLSVIATHAKQSGFSNVLMLGTNLTMSGRLYHDYFNEYQLNQVLPNEHDKYQINECINMHLIPDKSIGHCEKKLAEIANRYSNCDSVALACTELPMVLNQQNIHKPIIDTTRILAQYACDLAYGRVKKNVNDERGE